MTDRTKSNIYIGAFLLIGLLTAMTCSYMEGSKTTEEAMKTDYNLVAGVR